MSRGTTRPRKHPHAHHRDARLARNDAHLTYREALAQARAARGVQSVPAHALHPGVIVNAWVDFTDGSGWKARPVVVLTPEAGGVRVIPCTSRPVAVFHGGVELLERESAGLRVRSWALVNKPLHLPRSNLLEVRGECDPGDMLRIHSALKEESAGPCATETADHPHVYKKESA
jgi:hypothetical protein